jgi:hypothetical protein
MLEYCRRPCRSYHLDGRMVYWHQPGCSGKLFKGVNKQMRSLCQVHDVIDLKTEIIIASPTVIHPDVIVGETCGLSAFWKTLMPPGSGCKQSVEERLDDEIMSG